METPEANEAIELKEKISKDSARIAAEIRAEIGELETEYIEARREQKIGIFLLVLAFIIFPNLLEIFELNALDVILVISLFFCTVFYGFKFFVGKLLLIKRYNVGVNKIIFTKVLSILGLTGLMIEDGEAKPTKMEIALKEGPLKRLKDINSVGTILALDDLAKSELITKEHNTNQIDNILEIKYKDSLIRVSEMDIRHETGSGKNRVINFIFHGYFVIFDLKRELGGKTFVSSEAHKNHFDNLTIFDRSTSSGIRETILEWNEFEDLLHVATTNEMEARYILTPDFMHDLYDWWRGRETNIRLSFIKNSLYILYPDNNIQLNQTIEQITDENITNYLFSIAWPLQNIIKLIDDVRL